MKRIQSMFRLRWLLSTFAITTDYGQEIEHTGHLVSELSLDYDISISRVFVSTSAWQHRDSPFLSKVREQARAA